MSLPIRILVMEDESASIDDIEKSCLSATADATDVAIDVATSASDALGLIDREDYDLIICDLGVPQHSGGLHGRTEAGLAVFERIQNTCTGTPVIVFSGRADMRIVGRFLSVGRQADLFGAGLRPMVQFFPKEDLPDFSAAVRTLLTEAIEAAGVSVDTGGAVLSVSEQRVLQNIGQRLGGDRVEVVEVFGSGLSDSKTLRAVIVRPNGTRVGQVVAKLGARDRMVAEAEKALDVAPGLPVGVSAPLLHVVEAGAGRRGGAFYQVAEDHRHTLFALLAGQPTEAAKVVQALQAKFHATYAGAAVREVRFKDVRRACISDLELRALGDAAPDVSGLNDLKVSVAESTQHGDLHGFNVLATDELQPALIDFADVHVGPACVDAITLELSPIFHPEGPSASGPWPSENEIRQWFDLNDYAATSPYPEYIHACRAWCLEAAGSSEEIDAVVLSYALRQLKYGNPTANLARALAEVAAARLAGH